VRILTHESALAVPFSKSLPSPSEPLPTAFPALPVRCVPSKAELKEMELMNKMHALVVAAILAVSTVFGLVAARRTSGLRSASPTVSSAAVSARAHKLDRIEASLRRALRDKPPALPALPASRGSVVVAATHVVFHRPAPIIVVKHRSSSEAESEAEDARETDD